MGIFIPIGVVAVVAAVAVRYLARRAEHANPPVGRFIDVDGARLHYVDQGPEQAQPVVLLHGNGTMIQDFATSGLLDLTSARYRVIVFDRPGYGYSTRPRGRSWNHRAQATLIFDALQRLGIEKPIIVGHSWGTLVALALAVQYPAYVRSLVLLSGYYFPTFRLDVLLMSLPAIPVLGDIIRYTIAPFLGRLMWPGLMRIMFGPAPMPPRFKQFPVWMALRPSQLRASAAESGSMIPAAMDLRRHYRDLKMPVVIMAGTNDRVVKVKRHSVQLHNEIPHSDLRLAPGIGHMIHHFIPQDVNAAIDAAGASQVGSIQCSSAATQQPSHSGDVRFAR
ncbi:MAG: alpha/beta hydrolase [Pseudomonadota bacterium]